MDEILHQLGLATPISTPLSPCFHIVRPLLTPGLNIAWGGQDMRGQPILRPGVKRGVRGCASLGSYRSGLSRVGVVTGLGSYGSG